MLTLVIERILRIQSEAPYQWIPNTVGIVVLVACMIVTASEEGFVACSEVLVSGQPPVVFDGGCLCVMENRLWPIVLWSVLVLLIAVSTLAVVLVIAYNRCRGRYAGKRREFQLGLTLYPILPITLAVYTVALVLRLTRMACEVSGLNICAAGEPQEFWTYLSIFLDNVLFLTPAVNLAAIIVYCRKFDEVEPGNLDLIESSARDSAE